MNSCTGKVVDWILNVSKGEIDYGKKSFAVFYVRACLKNKNCTKRMFYFPFS